MKPSIRKGVTIVYVTVVVAACGRDGDQDCLNLAVYPPAGITDQRQTTTACVEQWAARFAKSPDSPDDVARAAVTKCERAVQYLAEQEENAEVGSLRYNQIAFKWRQHAHAIVVQARAEKCYA